MAAYVIAQVKIKNPEKFAAYGKAAGPTIVEHGGELVVRAPKLEMLAGQADFDRCVIIKFADSESARTWYQSEAYQAAIPLRDEGADVVFTLAQEDG